MNVFQPKAPSLRQACPLSPRWTQGVGPPRVHPCWGKKYGVPTDVGAQAPSYRDGPLFSEL